MRAHLVGQPGCRKRSPYCAAVTSGRIETKAADPVIEDAGAGQLQAEVDRGGCRAPQTRVPLPPGPMERSWTGYRAFAMNHLRTLRLRLPTLRAIMADEQPPGRGADDGAATQRQA